MIIITSACQTSKRSNHMSDGPGIDQIIDTGTQVNKILYRLINLVLRFCPRSPAKDSFFMFSILPII